MSRRLYGHLLQSAEATLTGGLTTLVDATFRSWQERRLFADLSERLGVPSCIVHCQAPLEILRSRIEERARGGNDPSETDSAVLEWQQRHYEALERNEFPAVFEAVTSDSEVPERLVRQIGALRH